MNTARIAQARDEQGSTLLLTIFYCFLGLMVILVVVAATSLYIERKRLYTLADGAALTAAETFELNTISIVNDQVVFRLHDAGVRAAVDAYLADADHGTLTNLEVVSAATDDGTSATVTLRSEWHVPVASELTPITIPLDVTATARSVIE